MKKYLVVIKTLYIRSRKESEFKNFKCFLIGASKLNTIELMKKITSFRDKFIFFGVFFSGIIMKASGWFVSLKNDSPLRA